MIFRKRNIKVTICLFLLVLLSSCGQSTTPTVLTGLISTPTGSPFPAAALAATITPLQQTTTPTAYPILTGTFTPAPSYLPLATKSDEQVYIDPEGLYAVNIPVEWQAEDSPNSFVGVDGFFQTGYLPEMVYMRSALDVCQWLANIDTKDTYSVSWLRTHGSIIGSGCQLTSLPGVTPAAVLEVIENPSADFPRRFLYIKTDKEHFDQISYTLAWLSPVDETREERFQTANLRPEDISFWDNTDPLPQGFSVTEYLLPAEAQNAIPGEKIFLEFIPPEALPKPRKSSSTYTPKSRESVNETIMPFGYDLRPVSETHLHHLFKDGILELENIYRLPDVYVFSTSEGEKLVFLTLTVKDPNLKFYSMDNAAIYLVQNDTISLWEIGPGSPMLTVGRSIWADGGPLIMGLGDHTDVQLRNGNHDLVFSFATYFGTQIPIKRFLAWNDHWILAVSDFVIKDGEILNAKFGFEEVFNWYAIDDKPFYFFRKGPRVGFSYDGQFFPDYYHEIVHGYCCGLALNNPRMIENTVRFFGKRDGLWYYVVVEIK
ncbi:MAG: hypothetical protein GQ562_10195 [Anaerolineales bacterium]|nr:hypothetical protein [Anaerolineales bacterium]